MYMCSVMEQIRTDALEEGIAIGREEGISIGRKEGISIGRKEGISIGRKEGISIGKEEGKMEATIQLIQNLMTYQNISLLEACKCTSIPPDVCKQIESRIPPVPKASEIRI